MKKMTYNYYQLKIYFKEKFIEFIPILVATKNPDVLIKKIIEFYSKLLIELKSIEFLPDEKYGLSVYINIIAFLEKRCEFFSTILIKNDNNYEDLYYFLLDNIYHFLFIKLDLDWNLIRIYLYGQDILDLENKNKKN